METCAGKCYLTLSRKRGEKRDGVESKVSFPMARRTLNRIDRNKDRDKKEITQDFILKFCMSKHCD